MKKLFSYALFIFLLIPAAAFAFGGCEEDCAKCHSLNNQDAQQILEKLGAPQAKALEIKISPVKGLWEVVVEDRGTRGVMYVGFSKKHVVVGPVIEVDTRINMTQDSVERINRQTARVVDFGKIPLDNALVVGSKDAKYKVAVFTDPDCPFCAKAHEEMKKVVSERPDIAFFLKLMPLSFHPDAFWKSQSILCKKSLLLLEDNFTKKEIPKPDCDNKPEIENNLKLALELDITGTPTLVMPDGRVIIGAKDAASIISLITSPPQKEEKK